MFNMFKGLVGQKSITRENMQPILDKLKDHMIGEHYFFYIIFLIQFNLVNDILSFLYYQNFLNIYINNYECLIWGILPHGNSEKV